MSYLFNEFINLFWILTAIMSAVYTIYIAIECYYIKVYHKTMIVISIIYTLVAVWFIYLIVTIMY